MPGRLKELGTVTSISPLASDHCYLELRAPRIAALVQPGQFVFLRCTEGTAPLLRRPLSICRLDAAKGTIGLLVKIVGQGTRIISQYQPGATVDMMGPIGTAFPVVERAKPVLVAGGVGVAPLVLLAERLAAAGSCPHIIVGAPTQRGLFLTDHLKSVGRVSLMTEDGSAGEKGLPTAPLAVGLARQEYTHIYACGPRGMLAEVTRLAREYGIPGYISLEERLACGIGACSGCAVPVLTPQGEQGFKKVCVDGPIFTTTEVIFQ